MTVPRPRSRATRLVARQVSELMLARTRRWQALGSHNPLTGVVFATVLSGSIAHLPLLDLATGRWITVDDAPALGRPVTATAIAQSLMLPATTTRRRADELVVAGQLTRGARGFQVDAEFLRSAASQRLWQENARHLASAITSLAASGYAPAVRALAAETSALPPGLIERPLIAFELRMMETMTELYGDAVTAYLSSTIIAANIRHITADPALAQRYAGDDEIPPDSERRAVTLRALARAAEMPFETVRRRVAGLIARGTVVQRDAGVVMPTRVLAQEPYIGNNQRIAGFFEQMLETLIATARG